MNLYDRRYLRQYNESRQPWGAHTRPARRRINWWATVVPVGMALGALLMVALAQILVAWVRTL
jgi:hypothetical protein